MDLLQIKTYNDPILRQKCERVENFDKNIRMLYKKMLKVMLHANGIGLAAPQVGINKQIIVVDANSANGYRSSMNSFICLANPKIIEKSDKQHKEFEGCLSLPDISARVKRPKQIRVEGWSLNKNKYISITAEGLLARVIQHEVDHLKGVLIIDYLPLWHKLKAIKKLNSIKSSTSKTQ